MHTEPLVSFHLKVLLPHLATRCRHIAEFRKAASAWFQRFRQLLVTTPPSQWNSQIFLWRKGLFILVENQPGSFQLHPFCSNSSRVVTERPCWKQPGLWTPHCLKRRHYLGCRNSWDDCHSFRFSPLQLCWRLKYGKKLLHFVRSGRFSKVAVEWKLKCLHVRIPPDDGVGDVCCAPFVYSKRPREHGSLSFAKERVLVAFVFC